MVSQDGSQDGTVNLRGLKIYVNHEGYSYVSLCGSCLYYLNNQYV